jgi:hypothetical protein
MCNLHNTSDDIAHTPTAVRAQNLHSNDLCGLGNTVLSRGDGTRTVRTVTVSVLVHIVLGNGLTPSCSALELNVVDVDTGYVMLAKHVPYVWDGILLSIT